MLQIGRLGGSREESLVGDARFPCIGHADGQPYGIRLARHRVFTVRSLQSLLGFGESRSLCADWIEECRCDST